MRMHFCNSIGPFRPRLLRVVVSVIGAIAAAPTVLSARQLMTHSGSGVCIAAVETNVDFCGGRGAILVPVAVQRAMTLFRKK